MIARFATSRSRTIGGLLKAKDLCMIPNRLAIALQEDGWWVRSEIIWGKTNPMPDSSGRYRPSTAHEKIFLLTKSAKSFYDSAAVRKPALTSGPVKAPDAWDTAPGAHGTIHRAGREKGKPADKQRGHSRRHDGFNDRWDLMTKDEQCAEGRLLRNYEPAPLDVWPMSTSPFAGGAFCDLFRQSLRSVAFWRVARRAARYSIPSAARARRVLSPMLLGRNATLIELNPD